MKANKSKVINGRGFSLCVCDSCPAEFTRRSDARQFDICNDCSQSLASSKRRTHGDSNLNSRLYVTWGNMKRRCLNPTAKEERNYRSRGVTICDEWLSYMVFKSWALNNGYTDKLTIDREDNTKGYSPENCRFVDISTQNANKGITNKNKSGYIGVAVRGDMFTAQAQWLGKTHNLGRFACPVEAAKTRDKFVTDNNLPHTLNFI